VTTRRWSTPALVLAFVLATAVAVATGLVAHDRGVELEATKATMSTLTATVEQQANQLDRLRARTDALAGDLADAKALAARQTALLHDLQARLAGVCSGGGVTTPALPSELPRAVRDTAQAILAAAQSCDLAGLAALAVEDPDRPFEYGLDATVPPAEYWSDEESQGEAPMGHLIGLFTLPVGTETEPGFGTTFVWPSAASYRSWAAVPAAEQEAVRAWYAAEGLAVPVYAGNYWGWRLRIDVAGNWCVFVTSPD
jgi:hypothetical protein